MALLYVLQKISIPNYPAKFFFVNLMPFVNVNIDSYFPRGSRLKNTCTFPCVCPRVLSVLGSRLENEVYEYIHVSLRLSSVFIFTALSDGNYSSRRE